MRFSVVIPTFNRAALLVGCLRALEAQRYAAAEFEVLVVDDGSTDETESWMTHYQASVPYRLRYLRQAHRGAAAARNYGLASAQGELIAFLDNDCVPAPDWLTELSRSLSDKRVAGVGGSRVFLRTSLLDRYLAVYRIYEPRVHDGRVVYLVTGNCGFRRSVLSGIGGFDERITRHGGGEDVELCYRVLQDGYKLRYNPRCTVTVTDTQDLCGFFRRFYRYGKGLRDVQRRCGGIFWSSSAARMLRIVQLLGCPVTVAVTALSLRMKGESLRDSLGLSGLRYVHLLAYAIGYLGT